MFDLDWGDPNEGTSWIEIPDEWEKEFILTYVPEADLISWSEAYLLARQRDFEAAWQLEDSILYE